MHSLLRSRKIWLALFGVIAAVVLELIPALRGTQLWIAIDGLIVTVIMGIAIEDAGQKSGQRPPAEVVVSNGPRQIERSEAPREIER